MPEYKFVDLLNTYISEGIIYLKPSTQKRERVCAKQLRRLFRGYVVTWNPEDVVKGKALNGKSIMAYRERRISEGVNPLSVERELATASNVLKYCRNELDYSIPADLFKDRKRSKRHKVVRQRSRLLNEIEEERLLRCADLKLQDIILFVLETGLRRSELVKLRKKQIVADEIFFTPYEHKSGTYTSCFLSLKAQDILKKYDGENIFNIPDIWLKRHWYKAVKASGLENLRFHDLRRTCGHRLRQQYGLEVAQAQLRHKSKTTTEAHYAQSNADIVRKAVYLETTSSFVANVAPEGGIEPPTYALRMH